MNSNAIWTKIKREHGLYRYEPTKQYFARVRFKSRLYRRRLDTADLEVAKRKLRDFKNDLGRTDVRKGNASLAAALEAYATTLSGAESAVRKKHALIEKIKATFFGASSLPLRTVKPSQIEAWLVKHYGCLGASAYNSALTLIRAVLDLAVRDRIILESPAAHLRYKKRATPIRLTPTFEQFQAIVADIRAQHLNADAEQSGDFVEFLGLAGLGQAEASSIKRSDVELDAGRIFVKRRKTGVGFHIPIYPQLRPLVEKLCAGLAHDERLLGIDDARKALASACKRLGYAPFSQRSLRRMFITRALERGVDVKTIAEWQAHRDSGKMILQIYSHVRPVHSTRMAQLMTTEEPSNVVPMREVQL
jgi:integrase